MLWLKRNMLLVVGILIALGLLGGAVFYLVISVQSANDYQDQFEKVRAEFQNYIDMKPTPNKENIALADADTKRLEAHMTEVKKLFKTPAYSKMDDPTFKSLLENTLAELNRAGSNAAVAIPGNYRFTFTAQQPRTKFATNSVPAMYMQLMEIKSICNLLFQSKIHALEGIKRAPVSADDAPPTGADYIDRKITTNSLGIVVPYEVTFRCFSAELASVLNAFTRTEEFFLIKNVQVQGEPPAITTVGAAEGAPATMQPTGTTGTAPAAPAATPGTPAAPGATRGKAQPKPKTILDEKSVRVTVQLDLMRAAPSAGSPAVPPAPPKPPTQ